MDVKKAFIGTIAGAIFIVLYEYIVYNMLLANQMAATDLFVSDYNVILALICQIVFAFVVWLAFQKFGSTSDGPMEGVQFGIYVGLILAVMSLAGGIYLPLGVSLAVSCAVASFVELVGLGFVLGLVNSKC